ncbi:MAG: glycosyltransferase family 9 protein [Planctomycetota bacterium]|nr:glycosyltransferase family 9 protein [Planctomycetota bacterium]
MPLPDDPSRILIIRPSALGDVCRTVPALASLKRRFPHARIDWLVQDDFAPAIAPHPDLDEVIPFPRRRFTKWWMPSVAMELRRWLRDLRDRDYDIVFDLQGLFRSGFFARATRAPHRVGDRNAPELAWLGLNRRHRIPPDLHAVDHMLAILEAEQIPIHHDMRLYTSAADRETIAPLLPAARPLIVVAPTSRWPAKRWPADRFTAVIQFLLDAHPTAVAAIVGAPSERDQCAPILELAKEEPRIIDLVGATRVGGLLAVIERADLVIANDSAALHMAVGFDKPIVALFGPTRIDRVGPWRRDADVIQRITPADSLDHKHPTAGLELMRRITVDEVVAAAEARLAAAAPLSPSRAG